MAARARAVRGAPQLLACLVSLGVGAAALAVEGTPDADRLQISIEFPRPQQQIGDVEGRSLVSGRVLAFTGHLDLYEMVFAIDVSGSTAAPSGIDVDGDGKARGGSVFARSRGRADNVLAAELGAVRALVEKLDSRTTRVGVVIFSGDDLQGTPDALVQVPLTRDYRRVRSGLDEIGLVPPEGATNMAAGLRVALAQLRTPPDEDPAQRPQRFIVFLTDGQPELSYRSSAEIGDESLAVARQAAKRGVRILSFGVGRDAADHAEYTSEMAQITGGRYVPVRDLKTLSADVASVRFTRLASITLRNTTLDVGPSCQILSPDGRFAALLPVRPGANSFEVRARSTRETEETAAVSVEVAPGTPLVADLGTAERDELLRLRTICERPPSERNVEIETAD